MLKPLPVKTCPACRGTWFRQADYYLFFTEESRLSYQWADLGGPQSHICMTIAVCLCGRPQTPVLAGEVWGSSANVELDVLRRSVDAAQMAFDDIATDVRLVGSNLARPNNTEAIDRRLSQLEHLFGKWIGKSNACRKSPRGRFWAPPERQPATGKQQTHTRDKLTRFNSRRMANSLRSIPSVGGWI